MAETNRTLERIASSDMIKNVAKLLSTDSGSESKAMPAAEKSASSPSAERNGVKEEDADGNDAKGVSDDSIEWLLIDTQTNKVKATLSGIGKTFVLGRTHRANTLDLGITSSKVSRRQIVAVLGRDGIECEVAGSNSARFIRKDLPENANGLRKKKGTTFTWTEGDIIDFCWQTPGTARFRLKRQIKDTPNEAAPDEAAPPEGPPAEPSKDKQEGEETASVAAEAAASLGDDLLVGDHSPASASKEIIDAALDDERARSPPSSPRQRLWNHPSSGMPYRRWPSSGSLSPRLLADGLKQPKMFRKLTKEGEELHVDVPDRKVLPLPGVPGRMSPVPEVTSGAVVSDKCPFPTSEPSQEDAAGNDLKVGGGPSASAVHDESQLKGDSGMSPIAGGIKGQHISDPMMLPSESSARVGPDFQADLPMLMAKPIITNPNGRKDKGSVLAWSEAQTLVPISEEEAGAISDDESREWTGEDHMAFDKAMREYTKDFGTMARRGNFTIQKPIAEITKELIHYYYRNYKISERYRKWKQYMMHETRSGKLQLWLRSFIEWPYLLEAVVDNEFNMGLRERRATRSSVLSDKEDRDSSSSRPPSRTQQSANVLKELMEKGLVEPGPEVLSLKYHGKEFVADLDADGYIKYKNASFDSVSSWSVMIKKTINPKLRGDNGWTSVYYKEKPLAFYREKIESASSKPSASAAQPVPAVRGQRGIYDSVHQRCIEGLLEFGKIKYATRILRLVTKKTNGAKVWHANLCEKGPLIVDSTSKEKFNTVIEWLIYREFFTAAQALSMPQQRLIWNAVSLRLTRTGYKSLSQWRDVWKKEQKKRGMELEAEAYDQFYSDESERNKSFCKCRKKEGESDEKAWYIQCSKATSICNGWIHPKCFNLKMTRKEGDRLSEFICPLCSADGREYASSKEKTAKSTQAKKRKLKRANEEQNESKSVSKKRRKAQPTVYSPGKASTIRIMFPQYRNASPRPI